MTTSAKPAVELSGGSAMPLLGFGTWQMRGQRAYDAVRRALDVGYRHVDTATMYGNERDVGRAIRDSGVAREEIFVTTKMPPGDAERAETVIAASLEATGLDHVDLWLIHWPPAGASPRTWQRFLDARDGGLTREVGVSNYSVGQLDELEQATGERPAVNQIEWGPMRFDAEELADHRRRGVVLEGYSPFKTSDLHHEVLTSVADARDKSPAQVVLRWHLQHEVVAIPKSATPARIEENFAIFDFELSLDEMIAMDALGG